jgi:IS1 family transposase
MNTLPREKQIAILNHLVEGSSVRSTERLVGVCREAVLRLLVRVGGGCEALLDEKMVGLPCTRLELDELWAFVGKKARHVRESDDAGRVGDMWTFVAICADTKIVPTFMTGKRTEATTRAFVDDLSRRMKNHVQISTDALRTYRDAIGDSFGRGAVDYAQVTKTYEAEPIGPGRYSPPKVTGVDKTPIFGAPVEELVSTSYVERNNLNIRMGTRRFTRLTNAHSKKLENHGAAVALWFAYYNLARIHMTLRTTPAMAAGVSSTVWSMGDLLDASIERTV